MSPGGSQSEWQRRQAAQRREDERRKREQANQAKEEERRRKQEHLAFQQRKAEEKTAAVEGQVRVLEGLLADSLSRLPLTFQQLKMSLNIAGFDPGPLGIPRPEPKWTDHAPVEPRGLSRVFGGAARYERETLQAQGRFEAAKLQHREEEAQGRQAQAAARAAYEREVADAQAKVAARNAAIEAHQAAFAQGDPEAVEWFVGQVLDGSRYPQGLPCQHQVAYRPENRDLVVEFELPPQQVVPKERGYRYVKTRDVIEPIPRPETEIKQLYAHVIACVALRTLNEIFRATAEEVVTAVLFNGRVSTIDRTTGKPDRPHLLSVSAERPAFMDLVLAEVQPAACLKKHLNALVSPNPFDMEAIEPFIAFDLKRFRFADDMDVVAGLDSRPNLIKLSPTEFEHLVRQLFVAMGAEAWTTIPSKDGGVDAVATSKNLFFGGVCLIQAKRWTGLVGLESVHALTGVMADHNATTGVLVTTSWFGRASEQFAKRNRITLINGAELKQLIKKNLGIDVIPGTSPPRRLRASDNTQTGRQDS
jgi:restriction system protein